jgi:hypothetical protein
MSSVVDLAAWKVRRHGTGPGLEAGLSAEDSTAFTTVRRHPAFGQSAAADDLSVDRLDRAVQRLHALVSGALDACGRLQPRVETELLAIVGELTVGLTREAADRAERLADELAR